ncbi:MAG: PorV/PorQ family protein [Elusimicrobiales bacterium]|nr:PorV/PorQ family protein [Elusimicrobiales bacterium]
MRKAILTLLLSALPAAAFASGAGTTAAPFLKAALSPRAVAVGGAFSALADDSGAVFVNPAGLVQFDKREAALDFSTYLQDAKMGNLSYAGDVRDNRFGLGVTFMTVGGIERRGLADATGLIPEAGSFDASDMAVTLAFAKKDFSPELLNGLDGGFSAKFIRSSIDDESAIALAVDAGAIYRATEKIKFSLVLQNLGTKMKFVDESDPLPLVIRTGGYYAVSERFKVAGELAGWLQDEKFYPSLGGEYWFRDALALRGGYKFGYDTANLGAEVGLSLGFGVKVQGLGVDYAFLPFGDLGSIHRFGVWMQF